MSTNLLKPFFCLFLIQDILFTAGQWSRENQHTSESWSGNWFPYTPGATRDNNPSVNVGGNLYDAHHGVKMGVVNPSCDDGQNHVEVDWDFNPVNYTCFAFGKKDTYRPRADVAAEYTREPIPAGYMAYHKCLDQPIEYTSQIPTFGMHRPLWAKYGEYTFLPKQRWLHNLEHGGVAMLYHPCADKNEVNILRLLVRKCLYRHVITPYTMLSPKRPLALVTWGHRLEISKVDPEMVVNFIRRHALNGAERTARDGQYSLMLEKHADVLNGDIKDGQLCKFYDFIQ